MRSKCLLIVFICLISSACHPPIDETELDQTLQLIVDDGLVAGFAVAVFNKDDILFAKGYGYADLKLRTLYTTQTQQIVASVSKTAIGLALVLADEMALLSLDDPINNHLPFPAVNPFFPEEAITIRHLATHTSTIAYSDQISGDLAFSQNALPLRDFVFHYLSPAGDWYRDQNFSNNKPGTYFDYTNISAALAAYIVEYTSGMSFKAFTRQYLFEPMDLPAVSWYASTQNDSSSARLYNLRTPYGFEEVERQSIGIYPVRDLVASVEELTRYCQVILNKGRYDARSVFSEKMVAELLAPALPKNVGGEEFSLDHGLFWIIDKNQLGVPAKVIGHSGGDDGIFSMLWFDPKTELGYVMLANTSQVDANFGAYIELWQSLYRYGKNHD
ncbi:MAG: serine hydrolase domain-containing protein [Bacteroidota bacterium]